MRSAIVIKVSARAGGGKRYDIYINDVLVEGGFFSREVATLAASYWFAESLRKES